MACGDRILQVTDMGWRRIPPELVGWLAGWLWPPAAHVGPGADNHTSTRGSQAASFACLPVPFGVLGQQLDAGELCGTS